MATSLEAMQPAEDERLRAELQESREKLSVLERDLGAVDAELSNLGEEREVYDLLEQTCGTLQRLEELGAAQLFWGETAPGESTAQRLERARASSSEFLSRVGEIEQRRLELEQEIRKGQDVIDILEGDLFEIELEQEEKLNEWVVERDFEQPERTGLMPWANGEDDRRFRKSASIALLAAILLGTVVPMIDLPIPEFELIPEVPDRFARLIEQLPPPPPPPAVVEEAPPEEVEPEIVEPEIVEPEEPIVAEELPEEVSEEPAVAQAEPPPQEQPRSAGILAFRESFASLEAREPSALGGQARINNAGEAAVGRTERSMITSNEPGSSGGINLAAISRDVGGGGAAGEGLGGVELARVASSIGPGGNGDRPLAGSGTAGRTDEEIQIVFDRYKSALYRLYNRELRNDPTLRGQVVLHLTIEPDGSVSYCVVQSSTLGSPVLEQQIADRVKTFDFGAKEGIAAVTILYPIDFLPAG